MTFLSAAPSLSGTIFKENDLEMARRVWAYLEQRCAPGWFTKPTGILARMFESDTHLAAYMLIYIAYQLETLRLNQTSKSVPTFETKVRSLFTEKNEKALDERLTEIFVAALLVPAVSLVAFEPYVPDRRPTDGIFRPTDGQPPPSTDYAILLPDGYVAIEVTVLYIGQLEKWQQSIISIP